MKTTALLVSGVALVAALGIAAANAAEPAGVSVVRGNVQVERGGAWVSSSKVPVGSWVRAVDQDATLRVGGIAMRVEPGARVRVGSLDGQKVDARGGRVFVKVSPDAQCAVSTGKNIVSAHEGEFVLDAGPQERLFVLQGDARLAKEGSSAPLASWSKSIALDGPDVRRRNRNRRRFTQGEENQGKRIGEDAPPTQTPTARPTYTETPAYTPSVTPTTPPSSPPPTTPNPNPSPNPEVGGGGDPAIWIGGIVGAGALAFGIDRLVNDDSDDTNVFRGFRPASP